MPRYHRVLRLGYLLVGFAALALGIVGAFLPLLPTVPFVLLAAYCFAKSSPALERKLLDHPVFGPHILAWRERRAISRTGKRAAFIAFAFSAALGLLLLPLPWALVPLGVGVICGSWIYSLPEA